MSRDGRAENCSCIFRTSHIHVGRMLQGAREAMRLCPGMDGLKIAPAFSALPTSVWVVFRKEPGRRCSKEFVEM